MRKSTATHRVSRRARPAAEAPSEPANDPLLVPRPVLARAFGVTPPSIMDWLVESPPMPTAVRGAPGKAALFNLVDVIRWYTARLEAKLGGKGINPGTARAEKDLAQARLAEQTLKARSKELIPISDAEAVWAAHISAAKGTLLAWETTLAAKVARAATLDGEPGVEKILADEVHAVLDKLAEEPTVGSLATTPEVEP